MLRLALGGAFGMGVFIPVVYFYLPPIRSAGFELGHIGGFIATEAALLVFSMALYSIRAGRDSGKLGDVLEAAGSGMCIGAELGFAACSLAAVVFWYLDPTLGHLEPLVVLFGVAAASLEIIRRFMRAPPPNGAE